MKIIILMVVGQGVMWLLAWRAWTYKHLPAPEAVLGNVVLCFFFWWVVLPIHATFALNQWTAEFVAQRRARVAPSVKSLRSGQANGLYD